MIKYEKLSQTPDTNFDYAMGILQENNIPIPAVQPKEKKCLFVDDNLAILLRATGYNKAMLIMRVKNKESDNTTDIYCGEFTYEPTATR